MTPLQRTLAVALVTAEVHNRDVLEVLVNKEISDPQNFLWQAQLRWVSLSEPGHLVTRILIVWVC